MTRMFAAAVAATVLAASSVFVAAPVTQDYPGWWCRILPIVCPNR